MKNLILKFIGKNKYKIILGFVFITSIIINIFSIKSCSHYHDLNNNNIIALTDSIHYYKAKNGEIVASKKILEGDMTTLKLANDSLYNVVKNMKVKEPTSIVYIKGVVENTPQDTVWNTDTIIQNFNISKNFAFNNEYRILEGNVFASDSTLGLNITKDQTNVDYILAIENSTVKVKSSNPYVTFNEIQGITIPQQKHKTWGFSVGPSIYTGINKNGKFDYGIGVSLVYGFRIK